MEQPEVSEDFKVARAKAMDEWFAARPQIFRTWLLEEIFAAGFLAAWSLTERSVDSGSPNYGR